MPSFLNRRPAGRGLRGLFNRTLLGFVLLVSQGLVPDLLGQDFYKLKAQAAVSTVRISSPAGVGLGVSIMDGKILVTCAHVVGNQKIVNIESGVGRGTARVLGIDDNNDLAILESSLLICPARIRSGVDSYRRDSFVMAAGMREEVMNMDMMPGKLIVDSNGPRRSFCASMVPQYGYSGGAVLDDAGTLVGIMRGFMYYDGVKGMEVIYSYKIYDLVVDSCKHLDPYYLSY